MARNGRGDGGWGFPAFAILGALCPDIDTPMSAARSGAGEGAARRARGVIREEVALRHAEEAVAQAGANSTG